MQVARAKMDKMGPKQIAEMLWGMSHTGFVVDCELMDLFAVQVFQKISGFTAQQLTCTLWGFARLGYIPGLPLLNSVSDAISRNLALFTPKFTVDIMWALAKMEYTPPANLLDAALIQIADVLPDLPSEDLADLVWAFSSFKHNPGPHFIQVIMRTVAAAVSSGVCKLQPLITILVALRGFHHAPTVPLIVSALDMATRTLPTQPLPALLSLLDVLLGMGHNPGAPFMDALYRHLLEVPAITLTPAELTSLLTACAQFNHPPPVPLLRKLAAMVDGQLSAFNGVQLCQVLWCYALFSACTPDVWNTITSALGVVPPESTTPAALTQVYAVYLMLDSISKDMPGYVVPPKLLMRAWTAWKDHNLAHLQRPSDLLEDIARILTAMNVPHKKRELTDDRLIAADILMALPNGLKAAVEVCEREKFSTNVNTPTGSTVLRIKLLEAYVKRVVSVPYYEWESCRTDADKSQYMSTLLRAYGLS